MPGVLGLGLALLACGGCVGPATGNVDSATATTTGSTGGDSGTATTSTVTSTVTGVTSSGGGDWTDGGWTGGDGDAPPPELASLAIDGCLAGCALTAPGEVAFAVQASEGTLVQRVELTVEGLPLATIEAAQPKQKILLTHRHLVTTLRDLNLELGLPMGTEVTVEAQPFDADGQAGQPLAVDLRLDLPPAGATVWTWEGDHGKALAIAPLPAIAPTDEDGSIVVGRRGELPTTQILLRRFNDEGAPLWAWTIPPMPGEVHGWNAAHAVAVDPYGLIYVVGQRVLHPGEAPRRWISIRDPQSGLIIDEIVGETPGSSARDLLIEQGYDPDNPERMRILVVGDAQSGQGTIGVIQAYRPDLVQLWEVKLGENDPNASYSLQAIALDGEGGLAVGGGIQSGNITWSPFVGRHKSEGQFLWGDFMPDDRGMIHSVGVADGTQILAAGERTLPDNSPALALLRYNTEGVKEHADDLGDHLCGDEGCALALDPVGRLLVGGARDNQNRDIFVQKAEAAAWEDLHWQRVVSGEMGDDHCHAVAAGPDGQVYAAGSTYKDGKSTWWVAKLNP